MPLVKYRVRILTDEFEEKDYIPKTKTPKEDVQKLIIDPLKASRERLKEPPIELVNVEILDPFTHPHKWEKRCKIGFHICYECSNCGVESHRLFHIFKGEIGGYTREERWKSKKYEMCHDQLKEMPKATKLF